MDATAEMESLKAGLQELEGRIRALSEGDGSRGRAAIKRQIDLAAERLKEGVDDLAASLRGKAGTAGAAARGAKEEADRYVREHPWQSAAIAAAVGLGVAGLVLSLRSKDR